MCIIGQFSYFSQAFTKFKLCTNSVKLIGKMIVSPTTSRPPRSPNQEPPWRSKTWKALIFTFLTSVQVLLFLLCNFRNCLKEVLCLSSPSTFPQNSLEKSGLQNVLVEETSSVRPRFLLSAEILSFLICLNCIGLLIWHHKYRMYNDTNTN